MFHRFASPTRFLALADIVQPVAVAIALFAGGIGLYMALVTSPVDYQQGETVRIMYVHVPAAWLAMFVYASMAAAAFSGLVWRHVVAEEYARAVAPVGAAFTLICLVTGSLWGQPTWGTWWVWDARLTSVLVLFFLYLGYMALVNAFDDAQRGLNSGAVLLLLGAVNLPIIKFSVDWWNTLHQPASVLRLDGPTIHASMLQPLLVMALAYLALFVALACLRLRVALTQRRLRNLALQGDQA